MKILLVNPPQKYNIGGNLPSYVDGERGHLPPLGLLYVAAAIEQGNKHRCSIIDIAAGQSLNEYNAYPDLVGITATTFTLLEALEIAREVKKLWKCKVMMGGMHASIFPIETALQAEIDYVFTGEAENCIAEVLDKMEQGEHIDKIINGTQTNVQELPLPARHLVNKERYNSLLGQSKYITTMITSRGCPFNCVFCHRKTMGRKFRFRTAEQIYDEMVEIKKLGIGEILIYDDTFTVDKGRVIELCRLIIDSKLKIAFDIRTRVDCVNEEMLKLLKKAGCKRIHYGVEASSNEMLKKLGKGIKLEQVENTFKITKKLKIQILAYFIIGSPDESISEIENTIVYSKKIQPDYCHFAIMTPYPDTPMYNTGLESGKYNDYWTEFAKEPKVGFKAPYLADNDKVIMEKLLDKAYKSFYLRPSWIIRETIRTRSIKSLKRKAVAGIKMLLHNPT